MKILVTNFHPGEGGGHDTYIRSLCLLDSPHVSVTVAAPPTSHLYQSLVAEGYEKVFACDFPAKLQKEPASVIANMNLFRRIVRRVQPDIVHANGGADLFIDLWSHPLGRRYKVIRTHHAIKTLRNDVYHRWIYKRCISANIYVSETAMACAQSGGITPDNSVVMANGVDLVRYTPQPRNEELRASLGIAPGCVCFGSNAGLSYYKRVDVLIKAASMLKGDRDRFHIVVVGDPRRGEELEALAKECGLTNFTYAGLYRDVRPFVAMLDVGFILSDSIETASYGAREMLAMGKPLISSTFSGLVENVVDGANGFLATPGSVEETARAMKRFLEMPESELAMFSRKARIHAETRFDLNRQLEDHLDVYEKVAAGHTSV